MNQIHKRRAEPLVYDNLDALLDEVCPPGAAEASTLRALGRRLATTDLSTQSRVRQRLRAQLIARAAQLPARPVTAALRQVLCGAMLVLALLAGGVGMLSSHTMTLARLQMLQLLGQPLTVTVVPTPASTIGVTAVATLAPTPVAAGDGLPSHPLPSPVAAWRWTAPLGTAWSVSTPAPRLYNH